MKDLDKQQKDGSLSEDEKFSKKDAIQQKVDATNRTLEGLYDKKENEINS